MHLNKINVSFVTETSLIFTDIDQQTQNESDDEYSDQTELQTTTRERTLLDFEEFYIVSTYCNANNSGFSIEWTLFLAMIIFFQNFSLI